MRAHSCSSGIVDFAHMRPQVASLCEPLSAYLAPKLPHTIVDRTHMRPQVASLAEPLPAYLACVLSHAFVHARHVHLEIAGSAESSSAHSAPVVPSTLVDSPDVVVEIGLAPIPLSAQVAIEVQNTSPFAATTGNSNGRTTDGSYCLRGINPGSLLFALGTCLCTELRDSWSDWPMQAQCRSTWCRCIASARHAHD